MTLSGDPEQYLASQLACYRLRCGARVLTRKLPFILASSLVENVVLAVNIKNTIFQSALPGWGSVSLQEKEGKKQVNLHFDIPLVLDSLNLVIHA